MSLEILGVKPHRAILFGGSLLGLEIDNRIVKPLQGGSTLQGGSVIIVEEDGKFFLADVDRDKIIAGPFSTKELAKKELFKRIAKQQKYDLVPLADCETPENRPLFLQKATANVRAQLAKKELMKEAIQAALSDETTDRFLTSEAGGVQLRPATSYGKVLPRATVEMDIETVRRKEEIRRALKYKYPEDRFFSSAATQDTTEVIRVNPGSNTVTTTTTTTTTTFPESMQTFGLNNNLKMEEEEE